MSDDVTQPHYEKGRLNICWLDPSPPGNRNHFIFWRCE